MIENLKVTQTSTINIYLKTVSQLTLCMTYEEVANELDPVFELKPFKGTETAAQIYL